MSTIEPARNQVFDTVSRLAFGAIAGVLMVLALVTMIVGIGQAITAILAQQEVGQSVLGAIGYAVVSIAVFEVSKYLIDEEVMRGREMRAAAEARRSLTRFISTISIAVFLEGLVTVFRVAPDNISALVYPALLLITAMLLVLGLGVFQRLSLTVEERAGARDQAAEDSS